MHITTSVVSSNPAQLVSDLRPFYGFLWFSLGTLVFSTNKIDHHDIAEVLLKVLLSTIILTLTANTLRGWATTTSPKNHYKSEMHNALVLIRVSKIHV